MESECHTECSKIDLSYTMVKSESWKGIDDNQYNANGKEWEDQEKLGQNVSLYYHQVHYVVWPRILFREILWESIKQLGEKIGW